MTQGPDFELFIQQVNAMDKKELQDARKVCHEHADDLALTPWLRPMWADLGKFLTTEINRY